MNSLFASLSSASSLSSQAHHTPERPPAYMLRSIERFVVSGRTDFQNMDVMLSDFIFYIDNYLIRLKSFLLIDFHSLTSITLALSISSPSTSKYNNLLSHPTLTTLFSSVASEASGSPRAACRSSESSCTAGSGTWCVPLCHT